MKFSILKCHQQCVFVLAVSGSKLSVLQMRMIYCHISSPLMMVLPGAS